jgi:mannose-6-phosphate isomerase-like protein (cupin superfamily)
MNRLPQILLFSILAAPVTGCGSEDGNPINSNPAEPPVNQAANALPVTIAPEGGEVFWFFQESPEKLGSGVELRIYIDHVTNREARGSFAKFALGVGGVLPVHRHDKTEELAYVLSGEGVAVGLGENEEEIEMPISEGYVWYNAPGVWHAVRNTGPEPLSMIFATIPNEEKGLLAFFRKIGSQPGSAIKAIPQDEFARLAEEHDMIMRPPQPERTEPQN